jgi:drug/metabolite transporter (DMT)-like permease
VLAEEAPPRHREIPYLAIAAAVLAWGVGPLFVRAIDAGGITISFWRLWLAVPFTLLLARLAGTPLTWRIMKLSALPGALFGLSILFGFTSFQKTSLANATLIAALQPLLVLLVAGRLFGERVGRPEVLLGATSLLGIAMVVLGAGGTGGASLAGDLLAVANLFVFTVYFLVIKHRRGAGLPAVALLAGVLLGAAVAVTPVAVIGSDDLFSISGWDWFWLAMMVLVPSTIGHGLMNWAQRYVDVTISSLMTLANPVVTTIGAWLVYDQVLKGVQVLGAAVVMLSLAGIVLAHHRLDVVVAEEPL